jgi:hypothetical protein
VTDEAATSAWPGIEARGESLAWDLLRDVLAAGLGIVVSLLLLLYLHNRWDPFWAVVCGGIGGVLARRWVRPSYAEFPRYLRIPLSIGVVVLGTLVASWATLAREPLSYWIFRWREAITMPVLAGVLGLGLASLIYTHRRLERELVSRRQFEEDLAVASRIQQSLLGSPRSDLPWLATHAVNLASREVGGDYYELLEESPECVCFAVGDVSGKGVAAALLMASLQTSFLAAHSVHDELAAICSHVNGFLHARTTPERYATFFVGRMRADGCFQFVNAGHNPALLIDDQGAHRLFGGGLPLGLFPKADYSVQERQLGDDELIVVYTDGVTEAIDREEHEFGEERLGEVACAERHRSPHEIADAILTAVGQHTGGGPAFDDVTLMVIKRRSQAP